MLHLNAWIDGIQCVTAERNGHHIDVHQRSFYKIVMHSGSRGSYSLMLKEMEMFSPLGIYNMPGKMKGEGDYNFYLISFP